MVQLSGMTVAQLLGALEYELEAADSVDDRESRAEYIAEAHRMLTTLSIMLHGLLTPEQAKMTVAVEPPK